MTWILCMVALVLTIIFFPRKQESLGEEYQEWEEVRREAAEAEDLTSGWMKRFFGLSRQMAEEAQRELMDEMLAAAAQSGPGGGRKRVECDEDTFWRNI